LTSNDCRVVRLACCGAVLALAAMAATPARADFFDDARKTFTTDIPHFFQDDIPCAFGGQPTSHTKPSCDAPNAPAKPAADKDRSTQTRPLDPPPSALSPTDPPPAAAPNQ